MDARAWDRQTTKQQDRLAPIINASNSFALDLLGRLGRRRENIGFAPWSLWSGLLTVAAGATGKTRALLRRLLHLAVPENELRPRWKRLHRQLQRDLQRSGFRGRAGSVLWARRTLPLAPGATRGGARKRSSAAAGAGKHAGARSSAGAIIGTGSTEIKTLAVRADPEKARQAMNRWARRIGPKASADLVGPGVLHPEVGLLHTSVTPLFGALGRLFPRNYRSTGTFYLPGCKLGQTPRFKSRSVKLRYGHNREVELLDVPLPGGALALMVIVPRQAEKLAELQAKITSAQLRWWSGLLREARGTLTLPRLELGGTLDLSAAFRELGGENLFDAQATYGGIVQGRPQPLETVLHRAPFRVRAAAPPAPRRSGRAARHRGRRYGYRRHGYRRGRRGWRHRLSGPRYFHADRPFVLILRHRRTGAILYLARIYNPRPGGRLEDIPGCMPKRPRPGLRGGRWAGRLPFGRRSRRRRVLLTGLTSVGGLAREVVSKRVQAQWSGVQQCVEAGRKASPPFRGRARVGFSVLTSGRVTRVHLSFGRRRHASTAECVTRAVRKWRFPKNAAEATAVGFRIRGR